MIRILALALLLAGCGGDDDDGNARPPRPAPGPASLMTASDWEIGPRIDGENYSKGLPSSPAPHPDGFAFAISPTAEPHYVTTPASLVGKSRISMTYRVEAASDTLIYGAPGKSDGCAPGQPSRVTLYFRKKSDSWTSDGDRWWAVFANAPLSGAMTGSITAPLDGPWSSVQTKTAANAPQDFADAKRNANRVGFTFGNCGGQGHGALATAPAKFIVTSFTVE